MKVTVTKGEPTSCKTPALVLGVHDEAKRAPARYADLDKRLGGAIGRALALNPKAGNLKEITLLTAGGAAAARVYLVGLGKKDKLTGEGIRDVCGAVAAYLRDRDAGSLTIDLIDGGPAKLGAAEVGRAMAEGLSMGLYVNDAHKSEGKKDKKVLKGAAILAGDSDAAAVRKGVEVGNAIAAAIEHCRDLANAPGNAMTPTMLANAAKKLARAKGLKCTVLERKDMEALKMGALLGVAQGSVEPPKLITMEYTPKGKAKSADTICIVGKGLTFDAGGISLKPAAKMWDMKYDMCGGAAAISIMSAVADLKLPHRVVCVVPSTENMPGGRARKPGDVSKAMNGLTIEVQNTDAEGRLILADALYYAATHYKPTAMFDMATLTGAVITCLGHLASGMMGNDPKLIERLKQASEASGERVWEFPLWEEYAEDIKSDTCDLKNIGNAGAAGTIIGGMFLQRFVNDVPWVHLDIAGTAWEMPKKGHLGGGSSGAGVRILTQMILDW